MLRQDDLEVEILEEGPVEVQVALDPGSDTVGHLQRLELVEAEFSPLIFLADDIPEEDSLLRVSYSLAYQAH